MALVQTRSARLVIGWLLRGSPCRIGTVAQSLVTFGCLTVVAAFTQASQNILDSFALAL